MPKRLRAWLKNKANPTTEAAIFSDSGADASRTSDVEHSQDRAGTVGGVASASSQRVVAGSDGASEAGTGHMRIVSSQVRDVTDDQEADASLAMKSNAANLAKGVGTTLLDLTEVVSDVFPPLKSAAAGMNFLRKLAKTNQNTRGNKKDAERLLGRIEAIEKSWTTTNDTHALQCRSVLTE
ncbi:hypothetical protein BC835DRAFT_1305890 [Cytidiella melzeri]|nr:hypothetical protein BC835DRAFT_1310875 [Cytidiella melzeri]KAI0695836.1 hypothetical protein BC835DRAFT_1305890 [Cytidiella melzeri]